MATGTLTDTERISRLEGAYEHLATKADLERLRGDLMANLKDLEIKLTVRLVGIVAVATGVIIAVDRLVT